MTDEVASSGGQYFSTPRRDDGRVLYNARMRRIARASLSVEGLFIFATTLIATLSWSFADPAVVFLAAWLLSFGSLMVLAFRRPPPNWRPQWSLRQMLVVISCLAVVSASFTHQAPFRWRFALSRSSLEHLADQIEKGEPVGMPQRGGFFVVHKADSLNDGRFIRLWIDSSPCEFTGFVRRRAAWDSAYRGNEWYNLILDDRWQYFEED